MKYKMICIDMDGTLLNSKKVISEKNRECLKKAYDMGVHIIICTGRNAKNAIYFSNLLGVNCAVIANNGAWVIDEDKEVILSRNTLTFEQCNEIREICKKYKGVPSFHSKDKVYWNSKFRRFISDWLYNLRIPEENKIDNLNIRDDEDFKGIFQKEHIGKCIIIDLKESKLLNIKNELNKIGGYEICSSGKHSLEINNKGVSKGKAVKLLGEKYNIKREEIICIGDNENDISMVEYAGLGVAMGNGIKSLKEVADYITDSNDNDGVSKVICEFILKND